MFYEGLYVYQKTGVNTARTLYIEDQEGKCLRMPAALFDSNVRSEEDSGVLVLADLASRAARPLLRLSPNLK